jgi:hypothetical protein
VYLPFDWQPFEWGESLQIQRWLPDGTGGHFMLERDDWWCGAASGELPPTVTDAVNEWFHEAMPLATEAISVPAQRGWQVSIGYSVWFCAHEDFVSLTAIKIAKLVAILAPHAPPLAAMASASG